ncbi:PhzF family phenazine biosynthesis isomerase [Paenibacillus sp. Marseille-Q4541]|uniref:PhzF family phenazine biosynthesis isomerase n=1 Tax=Paenibacillus sp. Marseille-Q4541 TaxID=2831522 RepID=UPI001BAA4970
MEQFRVYHYDSFTSIPHQGNPAGVVFKADRLSDSEMQLIAHRVGFNETVFVLESNRADIRLRYFTPGHEIGLCGHATIASIYGLHSNGMFGDVDSITLETKDGILPVSFSNKDNKLYIKMKQHSPQFLPFEGKVEELSASIGISPSEMEMTLPIVYGSTGAWTLLIPVKRLSSFREMKPNNNQFPNILKEMPKASVHPFCMEVVNSSSLMHARHFSSPFSGTTEDAVTGTASGVMGAYYLEYMDNEKDEVQFIVEQGQEIGKDGRVHVDVRRNPEGIDVYIEGTAVYVGEVNWKK